MLRSMDQPEAVQAQKLQWGHPVKQRTNSNVYCWCRYPDFVMTPSGLQYKGATLPLADAALATDLQVQDMPRILSAVCSCGTYIT